MKRRVGKYKDKIIVEGDKNEFKSHEVSIKELAGTDNMGGGDLIYYKIKPIVESPEFITLLTMVADKINYAFAFSGEKVNHYIGSAGHFIASHGTSYSKILAIGVSSNIKIIHNDGWNTDTLYEGPFVSIFTSMLKDAFGKEININDYLEPITEEEFYNIKPE